ncbi:hypothetical protein [Sphingobacterium bambusae]|uniref:Uncharacterized protein n=1 Tax=Sphingobacterium bambusae TaxID=662858 RepID=A0ABW6BME8_9SPHI|nr:hypothetical protein [Sphingobacterium bambusae]WPL49306.1 hypothetical protein SCB77_02400 [Sphingobacterium bambusae]
MATNYYFADKIMTEYRFLIKEKSSMPSLKYHRNERESLVRIDYFSIKKELEFSYADTDEINKADSIKVTVRKGGLGFDVLEDYNVLK